MDKLIILKSEHDSIAAVAAVTDNRVEITINGDEYLFCDVLTQSGWASVEPSLDSNKYAKGAGVRLPSGALG